MPVFTRSKAPEVQPWGTCLDCPYGEKIDENQRLCRERAHAVVVNNQAITVWLAMGNDQWCSKHPRRKAR